MAHKVISERIPNSLQWIYSSAKDGKSPTRESPPSVCDKVHLWQIFFHLKQLLCNSSTLMRRASNLELCERFLCGLSLVKVGDRRIVGWADAAGLTNCFHTETISMGKFHKPLSCPPSRPIFDAHFAVQLVPAQWEPSRHTSAPIFTYMSTLHCPQCPGVHINSLQKGYIFEYRFLNHTKYFFNFLTLMMVSFIVSCCCCCYHFVYLGIIFVVIIFIDFVVVIYHSYNICFPHVLVFAIVAAVECWDNFWADFHNAWDFPLGWVSVLRLPYPSCRPGGGIFSK